MIKAAGKTGTGLPLLLLGLSGENVTRMAAGEQVRITAADMTGLGLPPVTIVICYGRTEPDIMALLAEHGLIREQDLAGLRARGLLPPGP